MSPGGVREKWVVRQLNFYCLDKRVSYRVISLKLLYRATSAARDRHTSGFDAYGDLAALALFWTCH